MSMVFLEDEVHHLEDAQVYFRSYGKDPAKADTAIDLLLGTQGYERGGKGSGGGRGKRERKEERGKRRTSG